MPARPSISTAGVISDLAAHEAATEGEHGLPDAAALQVLRRNAGDTGWEGFSPVSSFEDLTDVNFPTFTDGTVPVWDQATGKLIGRQFPVSFRIDDEGAVGDGVADDRDPFANAVAKAVAVAQAGGRGIVEGNPTKTYKVASGGFVYNIPPGLPGDLIIRLNGAKVKLTSACWQLFLFDRTADYQTFQRVKVCDMEVDAGTNLVGGAGSVILGNYVTGVGQGQRMNYDRITIEDIYGYGINPFSSPKWVWMTSVHPTAGETETRITNVRLRRLDFTGGLSGIVIAGQAGSFAEVGTNVYMDEIHGEDLTYDCGATPTASAASSGVQFGNDNYGGRATLTRIKVRRTADVGIEVDGFQRATIDSYHGEDCWNTAFTTNNYTNQTDPDDQSILVRDSSYVRSALGRGRGFGCGIGGDGTPSASSAPLGKVSYQRCKSLWKNPAAPSTSQGGFILLSTPRRVEFIDCQDVLQGWSHDVSGSRLCQSILVQPGSTPQTLPCQVVVRNHDVRWKGTRGASGGTPGMTALQINTGTTVELDVDGVTVDYEGLGTALQGGSLFIVKLAGTVKGQVHGLRVVRMVNDSTPRGVDVAAGTTVSTLVSVEGDFATMPAGTDVNVADSATRAKVLIGERTTRRVAPAAAAVTVAASPSVYQNLDMQPQRVIVRGGTVTSIELSLDGTNWEATGATAGAFVLAPGDQIRVTYSSAPTMRKVPLR